MTRNTETYSRVVNFVKESYQQASFIPLHEPRFVGNEKKYLEEAIDSTFVSSVGPFVNKFEEMMATITGARYAVAIGNGTSALHLALVLAGVNQDDEVITQALTFVATANAISYLKARPVFVDVDNDSIGMSPERLRMFLEKNAERRGDGVFNRKTNRRIAAVVPMHTFGMPCRIAEIQAICRDWKVPLIEDSAESLGSKLNNVHTGTFGQIGIFSFNGNKTVTCGGGGAIITDSEQIAKRAKHLSTQAKMPHRWNFDHDEVGYNYRLPNLNAALACAQLEKLDYFIQRKRELALSYSAFFKGLGIRFVTEREGAYSNYWLNTVILKDAGERDEFLAYTNDNGVMTRPAWTLMNDLKMFENCTHDDLEISRYLADRLVNIPSSVIVR